MDNGQLYTYKGNYAYFSGERKASSSSLEPAKRDRNARSGVKAGVDASPAESTGNKEAQYRIDGLMNLKKNNGKRSDGDLDPEPRIWPAWQQILEVENLSKRFGDKVFIDRILRIPSKRPDRVGLMVKAWHGVKP